VAIAHIQVARAGSLCFLRGHDFVFFFKQKTAYEIGLGIPAEPLSDLLQILEAFLWFVLITLLNVTLIILTLSVSRLLNLILRLRSEERRVGKECRYWESTYD